MTATAPQTMTTEVALWIIGQGVAIIGIGIGAYINLVQRVTKVEVVLQLMGDKAAKILHSPHTPELDALIEKHIISRLENGEVDRFLSMLTELENDLQEPKASRLAAMLTRISVCRQYGKPIPDIPKPMLRYQ